MPEIASGEAVTLAQQDQPFVINHITERGKQSVYALELGSLDEVPAMLEIVRDSAGTWYGFRAAETGHRFLQASRKPVRRLLFFNHNFGTNEQWALVRAPEQPWQKAQLHFRHRRFTVRICLCVDVAILSSPGMCTHKQH